MNRVIHFELSPSLGRSVSNRLVTAGRARQSSARRCRAQNGAQRTDAPYPL